MKPKTGQPRAAQTTFYFLDLDARFNQKLTSGEETEEEMPSIGRIKLFLDGLYLDASAFSRNCLINFLIVSVGASGLTLRYCSSRSAAAAYLLRL
jgi:hypothetical protein